MLNHLTGDKWLMASLMYGAGLRLMECLRLRVQDIARNEITVRDGQGPDHDAPQVTQETSPRASTQGQSDPRT
ncbi:MAG: hypothetical protein ACUVWA_10580, partial [Candidatus Oleimicrobiaceae bacterium]